MVKSINAYFDSLVDRGGPFLRLAMGHSVRGVALLVVGMVAGIMLQYLPDVVLNCLFFSPFAVCVDIAESHLSPLVRISVKL